MKYDFRIFVLLCLHQASWTVHCLEVIVLMNTSLQHLIRWGSCYWKKWWCTLEDAQFWGMDIILSCLIWYFICPFIFSVISPASMLWLYNFVKYCPLMAKNPYHRSYWFCSNLVGTFWPEWYTGPYDLSIWVLVRVIWILGWFFWDRNIRCSTLFWGSGFKSSMGWNVHPL